MKLKQGDYLPVSEIKTETDFNNVIKAAENCGFDISATRGNGYKYNQVISDGGIVYISDVGSIMQWIDGCWEYKSLNKLTLSQWIERGGVKPEPKEWYETGELPPVGIPVLIKNKRATRDWAQPDFHEETVVAYGKQLMILAGENETVGSIEDYEFKPLKSKADQEREELIDKAYYTIAELNQEQFNAIQKDRLKSVIGTLLDNGYRKVKPFKQEEVDHLLFIYNRMKEVHLEKENVDYMLKFAEIIDNLAYYGHIVTEGE